MRRGLWRGKTPARSYFKLFLAWPCLVLPKCTNPCKNVQIPRHDEEKVILIHRRGVFWPDKFSQGPAPIHPTKCCLGKRALLSTKKTNFEWPPWWIEFWAQHYFLYVLQVALSCRVWLKSIDHEVNTPPMNFLWGHFSKIISFVLLIGWLKIGM